MTKIESGVQTAGLPAARLYSPRQLFLASFLGSPLAAAWLLALNYRALGDRKEAHSTLMRGVAATAFVFGVASFLPSKAPSVIWPLLYCYLIQEYARKVFGARFQAHLAGGGRQGSWWVVFGVGLLCLLVIFGILFAMALFVPRQYMPG